MEKFVTREGPEGQERKYYRSRVDRWYGGIVTLDAVGCGLLCKFCWVRDRFLYRPTEVGEFFSPEQAANRLLYLAEKSGIRLARVSGGEPTIGKAHLLQLLENLRGKELPFILETNGILINEEYARDLAGYPFIHVRVSLKGCNKEEFFMLTGAKPEGFELQLQSLKNMVNAGVSCHPACMISFSPPESRQRLLERLRDIDPRLEEEFEVEELILYPQVQQRIRRYGLRYYTAYSPSGVPERLI